MTATSHLLVMIVYACLVGAVGGALVKDTPSAQVRAAASIAGSLLAGALVLGWILFAFPL
jgi:undecaprenyl pyrophosphate phosphatase UppP